MTAYNSDIWKEVPGKNVYTVPEMYFTTLPGQIMSHIYLNQTLQAPQQTPYQVPVNYFETLSSRILSQVHLQAGASQHTVAGNNEVYQELQQLAPLLNTISRHNVFSVPEGYFNTLQAPISVIEQPIAKVVPLSGRIHKWVSYSTAAALAAIMVTAAFMFTDNNRTDKTAAGNYYKNINAVDVKKEVSVLSEDEIVSYLSTHPSSTDVSTSANSVTPDIQHIVNDISEEEIRQYLKENSEPGEGPAKGI